MATVARYRVSEAERLLGLGENAARYYIRLGVIPRRVDKSGRMYLLPEDVAALARHLRQRERG